MDAQHYMMTGLYGLMFVVLENYCLFPISMSHYQRL